MFNQCEPRLAVKRFVGEPYIKHNPRIADGKAAFIDYFEGMARDYPGKSVSVKRAVAEGDLVVLHCHQVWPGEVLQHWAGIDILRFDGYGKLVEHWDVLQIIPQGGLHSNAMF